MGARWSINTFAFTAEDMVGVDWSMVFGPGDDEEEFGGPYGRKRGQRACAIGSALVAHLSYSTQHLGIAKTDILARYALLAEESMPEFDDFFRRLQALGSGELRSQLGAWCSCLRSCFVRCLELSRALP